MTDVERFEAFVRTYQDMVYATAVRLLGNPAEAEDVAQSVFLKAFEQFDDLSSNPAAAGWLKTVARNTCLNHLTRYRARWRFFSELGPAETDEDSSFASSIRATDSPSRDFERADDRARLEQALQQLPAHQRIPLVLFHFEEASYEEIARALRISLAKVKTDIHRGREALRKQLETRGPAHHLRQGSGGQGAGHYRDSDGSR